jgi:ribonuclease T2
MMRLLSRLNSTRLKTAALALVGCLGLVTATAEAQRPYSQQGARTSRTYEAGKFDYYVLSLSWSPSFCSGAAGQSRANESQCAPRNGKKFSFVLHGLWPQFERGWPQDCQTPDGGYVPRATADRMLDIMPSEKLVFHEYRKHGTCSGLGIDGYFDLARKTYNKVQVPARYANATDPRMTVGRDELLTDFMAANPGLGADMIAVKCAGNGNQLEEVRICFGKDGNFRACGKNENQAKMCSGARIYVPPVRAAAVTPAKKSWFSLPTKPTEPAFKPPGQRTL